MNVIFDIGKVLVDFDFEGFAKRILGEETAEKVIAAMWGNPYWLELDRGVMRDEEVLRKFIEKAPDCEQEIRLLFSRLGEIPKQRKDAIPLIQKLKADGHRVFFLSNYFEYLMHTAPQELSFIRYMDGGIFSCFEHIVKPDYAIFRILCERYSLDPADCIFIDDTELNVRAAEVVGMKTIHFKNLSYDSLYEIISGE
ncbi:putative hydrolase of the HAD superfamily [Ruminococcus sp. YE71]|uniref:HAD family hydrolase n=1 Tax=unclassified Ruminococcus TaxID=2608920 RepID=UPI00088925DB|nr:MULTISPECIES: HAD family phosphatase [unclassified Ruminococcus]SDA11613.1 putative hydrolase of the HAD superfamily [Ruminococcus sp. YE78]SFW15503.1 putative hydrolase of the HAD superfamily [Ruminococcus sp. YE71]